MVLEPRAYSEKRNFIRMKIDTPVELRHGGETLMAQCRDLSGSGLLLNCTKALPLNVDVEVHIAQEGDNRQPFNATAKVVRVDATDGGFIIGLALTEIRD